MELTGQIKVSNLSFAYSPEKPVISDLNCVIAAGEKVAVLGHNGAGKTTFFNLISGLNSSFSGEILLEGSDIRKLTRSEIARKLSIVPQKHEPMFPFLTRDFILMGRYANMGLLGNPSPQDRKMVEEASAETGADKFIDRPYNTLSGGEMQLALIARSLCQQASILILDEPNTHLDFRNRFVVMDMIRQISQKRHTTLLMSLHDPNDVLHFADRVLVMHGGSIVADGPPQVIITEELLASHLGIRTRAIKDSNGTLIFQAVSAI